MQWKCQKVVAPQCHAQLARGEPRAAAWEENPVLPAPGEPSDSGMVRGCERVGSSRAGAAPCSCTETHLVPHRGSSRDEES